MAALTLLSRSFVERDVDISATSTSSVSGASASTTNTNRAPMPYTDSFGTKWQKDTGGRQAGQYQQRRAWGDDPSGHIEITKQSMIDEDDVGSCPQLMALDFGPTFPSSLYQHHAENAPGVSEHSLVRDLNDGIIVETRHLPPTQDLRSSHLKEENRAMRVGEKGKAVFNPPPSRSQSNDTVEEDPRGVYKNHQANSPVVSPPPHHNQPLVAEDRPNAGCVHVPPATLSPSTLGQNTQISGTTEPQGHTVASSTINSYEYDVPSPEFIYPFKGVSGLYVGFEDKIKPPKALLEKWRSDVCSRLWNDLRVFQNRMKTKGHGTGPGLSLELRMSGYAARGSKRVALSPVIWILYDRHRWRNDIRAFCDEIDWPKGEGFGEVEIRKGCPQFRAADNRQIIEDLDLDPQKAFRLTDEVALYLHIEQPKHTYSACGLLCCSTMTKSGTIISQQLSRIGGLIYVDGEPLGITTAHSMLEHVEAILRQKGDISEEAFHSYEYSDSGLSTDDEFDTPDAEEDVLGTAVTGPWDKPLGQVDVRDIFKWEPIHKVGPTGFLGASGTDLNQLIESVLRDHQKPPNEPLSAGFKSIVPYDEEIMTAPRGDSPTALGSYTSDSDFTLWNIPNSQLYNQYGLNDSGWTEVTSIPNSTQLSEGPVQLVLRPREIVQGQLLPGSALFSLRGVEFETMKIRIAAPLAKGCSGCWVVRGQIFCGMIIAAYENEPYAHMVSSPKLVHHILTSISAIRSIRLVIASAPTQAGSILHSLAELIQVVPPVPPPESRSPVNNTDKYSSNGEISLKGEWAVPKNSKYEVIEDFSPPTLPSYSQSTEAIVPTEANTDNEWSEVGEDFIVDESSSDWEDCEVGRKPVIDETRRVDIKTNLPLRHTINVNSSVLDYNQHGEKSGNPASQLAPATPSSRGPSQVPPPINDYNDKFGQKSSEFSKEKGETLPAGRDSEPFLHRKVGGAWWHDPPQLQGPGELVGYHTVVPGGLVGYHTVGPGASFGGGPSGTFGGGPVGPYGGGPGGPYDGGPVKPYSGNLVKPYSGGPVGTFSGGPGEPYGGGSVGTFGGGPGGPYGGGHGSFVMGGVPVRGNVMAGVPIRGDMIGEVAIKRCD